jgi:hypothetical protein
VDRNPEVAARELNDKHVIKLILEGCQLMTTVLHRYGEGYYCTYKPTHHNHPCTRWAGDSKQNFMWLWFHTKELCKEYTRRYGKVHKSEQYLAEYMPPESMPDIGLTPFAQAMPDQYKHEDAVIAYRNYYHGEKASFSTWKTQKPHWWKL